MSTLHAYPPVLLDEDALEFISTFISHVETIAGRALYPRAAIARARALLVVAIAPGDGVSVAAWRMLYRTISDLVATAGPARGAGNARAYLQSFLQENADLAATPVFAQASWDRTAVAPSAFVRDGFRRGLARERAFK